MSRDLSSTMIALGRSIGDASLSCATPFKDLMVIREGEKAARWDLVVLGFAYLFLHLVNRFAHSSADAVTHKRLTNELGPLVLDPLVSTFYGHWPDEYRRGVRTRRSRI